MFIRPIRYSLAEGGQHETSQGMGPDDTVGPALNRRGKRVPR